ncbi:MAG: hypothetical protein KC493_00035 [Bacteriovoracaceae bacterium]|nr:hypothetical protein [Bacteriovoracaceae bacterium]
MGKDGWKIHLYLIGLLTAYSAFAVTDQQDLEGRVHYKEKCQEIKKYIVGSKFSVDCYHNYHHYNSKAYKSNYNKTKVKSKGRLKVAGYNLWHPGSLRSGFKDLTLVAKIMNRWDLISATELLPVIGRDEENNKAVVEFLEEGPSLIEALKKSNDERISEIKTDLKKAKSLYRAPGYLKILEELRKLDRSWALLLAPRGEAAKSSHVQELVGFFYRSSMLKPIVNEHCEEYKTSRGGTPFACIPNLKKEFMGRDTRQVFSRRPFMANFESGNFDFTMITSHIIFTSPDEENQIARILKPSFGVSSYEDIGIGVTKETYARVAETKIILEFMNKLREFYYEEDILYTGDMNLNHSNQYWSELLKELPGSSVFVKEPTTLSQPRFHSTGVPTNGNSNDFDHFIFSKKKTRECMNGSKDTVNIFPYYTGTVQTYLKSNYLIRDPAEIVINTIVDEVLGINEADTIDSDDKVEFDYSMIPGAKSKMSIKVKAFEKSLKGVKTIKNNRIVWDDYRFKEKVEFYKRRVFTDQLRNRFYYRVYAELISDHFPIYMTCKTSMSDDDSND